MNRIFRSIVGLGVVAGGIVFNAQTSLADDWDNIDTTLSQDEIGIGFIQDGVMDITGDRGIPINNFANAASTDHSFQDVWLAIDRNAFAIDYLAQEQLQLDKRNRQATAALAALDFERPGNGQPYRLSVGAGTYRDEAGIGIGLTAVLRDFDFALGVGVSGTEAVGKVSVGFSFGK